MRILQLGKFYPIRGGVEKVMLDLAEGLGEKGVECDMLCAASKGQKSGIFTINAHARVIVVPALLKLAATMISPAMILYLRRHKDYDIIHIHHPDPMAALSLWCSGYKGKVVLHWHSDIIKQKFIKFFYRPLQNWILRKASLIVGTTPVYVRESPDLKKFQDKTAYLPIGVDVPEADKSHKTQDGHLIFALGRFVEYKGFEYLVRAVALLPDGYHIVIGGQGPLKPKMEALAKSLGVSDKISFPGYLSDENRAALFSGCDLFVLSSIHKTEAFAIVQIEAMAYGKPIVATNIPESGVSWVNADGVSGINVPVKNPEALAKAIINICSDNELYSRLSAGAKDRYSSLFTKEKMIDGCLSLYSKVLG